MYQFISDLPKTRQSTAIVDMKRALLFLSSSLQKSNRIIMLIISVY